MNKNNSDDKSIINFIIGLFNPSSPLIYTSIGAVLSTILAMKLTNNGEITHINLLYFVLGIWIFFGVSVCLINYAIIKPDKSKIDNLEEYIIEKDTIINEQKLQLKDEMYMIAGKYGEFSTFIKKEKMTNFLSKIVNNFTYLDSIQVHSFNIRVDEDFLKYKLTYDNGYVKEGANVNTINQQYYKVNKDIYRRFKRTIDYYKIYLDSVDEEVVNRIINDAVDILSDIADDYTSEHLRIFDILLSIIESLSSDEYLEGISDLLLSDEVQEEQVSNEEQEESGNDAEIIIENSSEIIDFKRTGILGSILMNKDYMYDYEKINNSKIHRKYFSFPDGFDDENKIITFIINSNSGANTTQERLINDVILYYEKLRESYFE